MLAASRRVPALIALLCFLCAYPLEAFHIRQNAVKKFMASIASGMILMNPSTAFSVDNTLKDQLKVVETLQFEQQKQRLEDQKQQLNVPVNDEVEIVKGSVYLPISNAGTGFNPSKFEFGFEDAASLDNAFDNDNAVLVLTAVGRDGPPFAARRIPLKKVKFPYAFELTTKQLLFPYNEEVRCIYILTNVIYVFVH
jgi:hypothetical protein